MLKLIKTEMNMRDTVSRDDRDIETILNEELTNKGLSTIKLSYAEESAFLHLIGKETRVYEEALTPKEYLELCEIVGVKEENNWNISNSFVKNGMQIRVMAITRPLTDYPIITISTTKPVPSLWKQEELTDLLKEVASKNFILVGATGAGKTYLMNYLLRNYHKETDNQIIFIEEFSELIKPNESTVQMLTPPAKPGEIRLLGYATQMTNLMRCEYVYVGEIKGEEAWPFAMNLSSGTKGGATVHGYSAMFGLKRLQMLAMLVPNVTEQVAVDIISKSINYVVYIEKQQIYEIAKLTGVANRGNYQLETLWNVSSGFQRHSKI